MLLISQRVVAPDTGCLAHIGPSIVTPSQVKRFESLPVLCPLFAIVVVYPLHLLEGFSLIVQMVTTNIVLFGEAGVGKSSVINLLAGKNVAEISTDTDSRRRTLDFKHYEFEAVERTINIWETIGLGGCSFSTVADCLGAIEKTYALIQDIEAKGGLHLLLFCIPESMSRISIMVCNYRLFFNVLCNGRVPIALVVTHLEEGARVDGWWGQNMDRIRDSGLQFRKHACVTSPAHLHSVEHREALVDLLLEYDHERRHPMPPAFDWLSGFLERLHTIPCPGELRNDPRKLEQLLCNCCEVVDTNACRLAEKFSDSLRKISPLHEGCQPECRIGENSSFNIVLFGEAGVGKSSIINLIAKREVARISRDAAGCTMESKEHSFEILRRTFNIWDTVGLGEPSSSTTNDLGAIEKTYILIRRIEARGGLDLLLFCIPGGRITDLMLSNYRLFFEVLCEKRIPISVVVTRLEREENLMEDWWLRNKEEISKCDLNFSGHACVTGLVDEPRKAVEGRSALELLLLRFNGKGRYTMPPASDWFAGFLERLSKVIPLSKLLKIKQTREELEQLLCDRCHMESGKAKRVAENLIHIRSQGR